MPPVSVVWMSALRQSQVMASRQSEAPVEVKSRTLSQVRRSPQFQIHCLLSFWTCKSWFATTSIDTPDVFQELNRENCQGSGVSLCIVSVFSESINNPVEQSAMVHSGSKTPQHP